MKEPKEYLKECGFKQYGKECAEEAFNDPELKFVIDAIKQAQIEAYNEAIDLAANIADAIRPDYAPFVKEPILKLKKL